MAKGSIATLLAVSILAACASPPLPPIPPTKMRNPFNAAEHDPFAATGTLQLRGQAFLRQRGGGTVTCAGSKVMLLPATEFFREFVLLVRTGQKPEVPEGKLPAIYKAAVRNSQCDAQGNFVFPDLPAGRYIAMTEVTWTVAGERQGGALAKEVEVTVGAAPQLLMSDTDYAGR